LRKKSLVLAKKEPLIIPGPGAYTNQILQQFNKKSFSIPKVVVKRLIEI